MIRRHESGQLEASCSWCATKELGGSFEFDQFTAYLRSRGWQVAEIGGEQQRLCPECSEELPRW